MTCLVHDKSTVIQEARVFNESPISPRKCRSLLARIVYLLYCGETFSVQEATQLFFGVTKLFQHKDVCSPPRSLPVSLPSPSLCLVQLADIDVLDGGTCSQHSDR
jgi:hypothetical protein